MVGACSDALEGLGCLLKQLFVFIRILKSIRIEVRKRQRHLLRDIGSFTVNVTGLAGFRIFFRGRCHQVSVRIKAADHVALVVQLLHYKCQRAFRLTLRDAAGHRFCNNQIPNFRRLRICIRYRYILRPAANNCRIGRLSSYLELVTGNYRAISQFFYMKRLRRLKFIKLITACSPYFKSNRNRRRIYRIIVRTFIRLFRVFKVIDFAFVFSLLVNIEFVNLVLCFFRSVVIEFLIDLQTTDCRTEVPVVPIEMPLRSTVYSSAANNPPSTI